MNKKWKEDKNMPARVIELILCSTHRGTGKEDSIFRNVTQLCLKDGTVVGEYDPCPEKGGWQQASWLSNQVDLAKTVK